MEQHFFRRRSVVIAGLAVIFSGTAIAFAQKASTLIGTKEIHIAEANTADVKPDEAQSEALPVISSPQEIPTSSVEGAVQEQAQPSSEETAKPTETSEGLVESVADAVKSYFLPNASPVVASNHPLHTNISTTVFWAGEEAGEDNKDISNLPSAWDEEWVKHFGGVDTPKKRSGFMPAGFKPKENPFYFALPYNDFDKKGNRKKEVSRIVAWAGKHNWKDNESVLKNQWIKITKGDKVAYAQWQDVGPFKEDDAEYVFGTAQPRSKTNKHAGLDVSPAVKDMLGLSDIDTVNWQFVNPDEVPEGPWKEIVTTSQINWK